MKANFYIVSLRWRSPKLIILNQQETINNLSSFIPKELIESRVNELNEFIKESCPSYHIDFYIFIFAILCVICSAIFTFIARTLNISMWCPLLLLLLPTGLSFWTSKRRSIVILKLKQFESNLKKKLYEYSMMDQQIIWNLQRIPIQEGPNSSARFCLLIQVTELSDSNLNVCVIQDEELPTYTTVMRESINHPPSYSELS